MESEPLYRISFQRTKLKNEALKILIEKLGYLEFAR